MISLDLMKSSEVRIGGDRSNYLWPLKKVRFKGQTCIGYGEPADKRPPLRPQMQSNQVCCPAADISYQLILLHKNVGFQLLKKPQKICTLLLVSFGFAKKKNT